MLSFFANNHRVKRKEYCNIFQQDQGKHRSGTFQGKYQYFLLENSSKLIKLLKLVNFSFRKIVIALKKSLTHSEYLYTKLKHAVKCLYKFKLLNLQYVSFISLINIFYFQI